MNKVDIHTADHLKTDLPTFRAGDTIALDVKVKEGDKERIQRFEGIVIKKRGSGINATFTVRKISSGIGVERVFLMNSPSIASLKVIKQGKVRRARLYYLRGRKGKSARVQELRKDLPVKGTTADTTVPPKEEQIDVAPESEHVSES